MSRPEPTLVIHVGQHKTGSKALQSFLAWNRRALLDRGLLYPSEENPGHGVRAYAVSQFRLYALVRREALAQTSGEAAGAAYWGPMARYCRPFESTRAFFESLADEARRAGARRVVVSAEDLFDMHTAHETGFAPDLIDAAADRLAELSASYGFEARVVVYLRRQDHLLGAHYVQYIKGSSENHAGFDEFARSFAPRLDAHRLLGHWARAFGRERVRVRIYEPQALPGGVVPDFFEHALGLSVPDDCAGPPADVESVNRSLGRDFVEFIRVLNRRSAAGGSVFDREAVLETALRGGQAPGGVASWLSPADRRDLLACCEAGNAAVARDYLGRDNGRLFAEPWPDDDDGWLSYPGLSADRATEMALAVHETLLARLPRATVPVMEPVRRPAPLRIARRLREAATYLHRRRAGA